MKSAGERTGAGRRGGKPDGLEKRLGVRMRDRTLLEAALTHPSFWGETPMSEEKRLSLSYERLEFLGDAVINLAVASRLFRGFPSYNQGKLSKLKSYLVSRQVLARAAEEIALESHVRLGKGVGGGPPDAAPSFLVDSLEALVGAVYVEKGYANARRFVEKLLGNEMEAVSTPEEVEDAKSALQETVQKQSRNLPKYKLVSETGPEHRKVFTVKVYVDGEECGKGSGYSKKEAERSAAEAALMRLRRREAARRQR
ncbi:MAG: ribonuclease III [bacterium]